MQRKLLYLISDIDKALAFEWVAKALQQDFDLQFVLIGKRDSQLQKFLEKQSIVCHVVANGGTANSFSLWWKVFQILKRERPQIIHTHLWRATLSGLTAAWLLRIPKRIYTRHHATIHHREYPSGLKWDKLCNFLATDIVAISENVKKILIELDKTQPNKVVVIRHGFDFNYFQSVESNRIQLLRNKLNLSSSDSPIIGVIARYTKWKGVQFVIDAFIAIRKENPKAVLILANATGDYKREIKIKLETLPKDSFREIPFEEDLAALYKVFDVYIHVPTDEQAEAFGQTYVEALVASVPSVFTVSGVAPEFIQNGENALTVPFKNAEAISNSVRKILQDPELANRLKEQGRKSLSQFSLDIFIQNLKRLYA